MVKVIKCAGMFKLRLSLAVVEDIELAALPAAAHTHLFIAPPEPIIPLHLILICQCHIE
jgi:hypothetical protein